MLSKRATRGAPTQAVSSSILLALDEDALVEVLCAAKAARTLAVLSSCSRRLCTLARSRLPLRLSVYSVKAAAMLLQSITMGMPPFTGCTTLCLSTGSAKECLRAVAFLNVAVQWTALQQLELVVYPDPQQDYSTWETFQALELCSCGVLSALPALKQLQRLDLKVTVFGPSSAMLVGQMQQLTGLELFSSYSLPRGSPPMHLTALSGLNALQELVLSGPPPVQAALTGPAGPFSLPSSLKHLTLRGGASHSGPAMSGWVTHLPGCPYLQHLKLDRMNEQHPSTHPSVLVPKLAAHNPHLRTLEFITDGGGAGASWGYDEEEEEVGAVRPAPWHPTAALAALTGLERLSAGRLLRVATSAEWRHLAQLTGLSKLEGVMFHYSPPLQQQQQQQQQQAPQKQQPVASIDVPELCECDIHLSGHGLGCLPLACPALGRAEVRVKTHRPNLEAGPEPAGARLHPHAHLHTLVVEGCDSWLGATAPHFADLAPVLKGLSCLHLGAWSLGAAGDEASTPLQDLSGCTALTALELSLSLLGAPRHPPEQEEFIEMLAPLVQLRRLVVRYAEGLTARVVVPLQHMLPQLQYVNLYTCGQLQPLRTRTRQQRQYPQYEDLAHSSSDEDLSLQRRVQQQQQRAQQLLTQVRKLLRPGLVLDVTGG